MNADLVRIRQLMNMTRGDEKHGSSTGSTLDVLWVLWVLYDRILHYDLHNLRNVRPGLPFLAVSARMTV